MQAKKRFFLHFPWKLTERPGANRKRQPILLPAKTGQMFRQIRRRAACPGHLRANLMPIKAHTSARHEGVQI
jgi:hypothetical protein